MDKRVSITGACVFPVALVEDVVGEDAKAHPALLATGRIARSEVEEVIAADAHRVIDQPGQPPRRGQLIRVIALSTLLHEYHAVIIR